MSLNQDQREYRSTDWYKENHRRWEKEYRRRNPAKALYTSCRKRAKKTGIAFDIEETDIIIPKLCPILEVPLVYCGPDKANWPTVDRIDNTKGYLKGNISVISYRANSLKSDALVWQIENLLAYMKGAL